MSSKRNLRRRSCGDKIPYPSESAAIVAIKIMYKKYGGDPMRAYKCKFCKRWHIGHQR